MGFLKFLSSIGTVGAIAWNAAIAYRGYKGTVKVPDDLSTADQETIDGIIIGIAERSQDFKPRAPEVKNAVLKELKDSEFKSLIFYCCCCLKHEASAMDIAAKTWLVWIEVIDEKLTKRGVPKEIRYGFACRSREDVMHKFLRDRLFHSVK